MERYSFKELLSDVKHLDLLNNTISLKGYCLFAPAEVNMGISLFRDSLYALLERNEFRNMRFENLLDTLEMISGADIQCRYFRMGSSDASSFLYDRAARSDQDHEQGTGEFRAEAIGQQ